MDETKKSNKKYFIAGIIVLIVAVNFYFVVPFDTIPQRTRQLWLHALDWHHWPTWFATFLWILAVGYTLTTLLQSRRVQREIQAFYASKTWCQFKNDMKHSGVNQFVVTSLLRLPFGKRILRRWIKLWPKPRIERYHRYTFWITVFLLAGFLIEYLFLSEKFRRLLNFRLFKMPFYLLAYHIYNPFLYGPWVNWMAGHPFSLRQLNAPILALLLIGLLLRFNADIKRRRKKS